MDRDDKRVLACIAGYTYEELQQLMTDLYGKRRQDLEVITGGAA